ncbi:hypothetical protein [Mesorhizobium sp. KR9-304]|uniref:hypothetical protein n=1 Tax=Mesorhizobium sp. KR9-304 TaxID=3156614 RepID=UPI0032B4CBDF
MTDLANARPLSVLGLSVAIGVALVVLFVLCALVELLLPGLPATHAWIGLFTLAPVTSPRAWIEGVFYSFVFGIVTGAIVAVVHNAIAARGD